MATKTCGDCSSEFAVFLPALQRCDECDVYLCPVCYEEEPRALCDLCIPTTCDVCSGALPVNYDMGCCRNEGNGCETNAMCADCGFFDGVESEWTCATCAKCDVHGCTYGGSAGLLLTNAEGKIFCREHAYAAVRENTGLAWGFRYLEDDPADDDFDALVANEGCSCGLQLSDDDMNRWLSDGGAVLCEGCAQI